MQIVLKVVIKYHTTICYDELIIGKLTLITRTITKKKGRKGAATLLYSMQIIIIVNITYYNTTTYNGLIIGKLTLITKKKEREGA